jgi:SagB-type dehydrogenase family enzyme
MELLTMHASLRCDPNSEGDSSWVVTNLSENRSWRLSSAAVGVLLAFGGTVGRTAESVYAELNDRTGVSVDWLQEAIRKLRSARLIVAADDSGHQAVLNMEREWWSYGWRAAFDHHLATFDYPFLDYAGDGVARDRQRMKGYLEAEPYRRPQPKHEDATYADVLPPVREILDQLQASAVEVLLNRRVKAGSFDKETLLAVLAATFGYLTPPGGRSRATRTSPSGGARHPTEAYLIVLDVPDLAQGVYHVATERSELEKLRDVPDAATIDAMFPGFLMAGFPYRALVVLTALFERNAYRYREPRTYRTIFMDAGHLAATLELSAQSVGLRCFVHHGLDDALVERFLGLSGMEQGVVGGAALG